MCHHDTTTRYHLSYGLGGKLQMHEGPTTEDLVAMVVQDGIKVTPRQGERWRHHRLLPLNTRKGREPGAGSKWPNEGDIGPRFLAAANLIVVQRLASPEAAVPL
jgi:hypothetical protein